MTIDTQLDNLRKMDHMILIAEIDESQPCEVDQTLIFFDKNREVFLLVTASGCSCWDGECEIEEYNSLDDIALQLSGRDQRGFVYNPSPKGVKTLLAEAYNHRDVWAMNAIGIVNRNAEYK